MIAATEARYRPFDLALVGAGVSGAFALHHVIRRLDTAGRTGRGALRVAVIDRNPELWRGIAYGSQSSANSLLIHSLRDFLPDRLREDFRRWLLAPPQDWKTAFVARGGDLAQAWLDRNWDTLTSPQWDTVFLPRRVFGTYISEVLDREIRDAVDQKRLDVTYLTGQVATVERTDSGGSDLTVETAGGGVETLSARLVILSIGSPGPKPAFQQMAQDFPAALVIPDPYSPRLDDTLDALDQRVSLGGPPRNILVLGSNASALEMVYLLGHRQGEGADSGAIHCLSPTGELPDHSDPRAAPAVALPALDGLLAGPAPPTAEALYAAILGDIEGLTARGQTALDGFPVISDRVVALLAQMTLDEVRTFHDRFGMAFTRRVRRAGLEYVSMARALGRTGRLRMVAGAFCGLAPDPDRSDAVRALYQTADGTQVTSADSYVAVINCTGGEPLGPACDTRPLAQLVRGGVCEVHPNGYGLRVNNDFEAAPDLYVAGPLLAGIFTPRLKTWHIENARRIYEACDQLAGIVMDRLQSSVEPADA
jgi:uncharacterized NAD(P)/FAD-binding protein YdhS